jgi:hypothetical protein
VVVVVVVVIVGLVVTAIACCWWRSLSISSSMIPWKNVSEAEWISKVDRWVDTLQIFFLLASETIWRHILLRE